MKFSEKDEIQVNVDMALPYFPEKVYRVMVTSGIKKQSYFALAFVVKKKLISMDAIVYIMPCWGDNMNLRMWIRLLYARRKFKGKCYYLSGSENLLAPLSTEEEEYWVKKYDEENSLEARNKLIEHNMRLVIYVAKKYETEYATLEDLVSIGLLGLFKAIKTFRYDKNIKLATYASRCIDNEILMFLRKNQKRKNEISLMFHWIQIVKEMNYY